MEFVISFVGGEVFFFLSFFKRHFCEIGGLRIWDNILSHFRPQFGTNHNYIQTE